MIKFAVEQWNDNRDSLESHFGECLQLYESCDYTEIVKAVVEYVYNVYDESSEVPEYLRWQLNVDNISEIDNGDYQGTVLYMLPRDTYQPSASEYLLTYTHYGSCSGCDALLDVQYTIEKAMGRHGYEGLAESEKTEQKERAVKDLMSLSLHLVQNTIRPYNKGWERSEYFDDIEYSADNDKEDGNGTGMIF